MKRILVIRGGAIGDFILTLPTIRLLRDQFPSAQIEILGNNRITVLAENRFYANRIRSFEDRALASFFVRTAQLPQELRNYFGSFDLIVSYAFDPERIFQENVERCGIARFLLGPAKLHGHAHAAIQLARPLEEIGLRLVDPAARLYPTDSDRMLARDFIGRSNKPVIALHPGSGSEAKNWSVENWNQLGENLIFGDWTVLLLGGEADEERLRMLGAAWRNKSVRLAQNVNLPVLAALLGGCTFVGHDSGISHLAAAADARCLLLFGQTDPEVWAPANEKVTVLQAPQGNLGSLMVDRVIDAIEKPLS